LLGGPLTIIRSALPAAAVTTGLRGRWEILGHHPLTVADTAHNAHGMQWIAGQLRSTNYDKLYIIIGVVADKDLKSILPLLPREAYYIFTAPSVARAMPAEQLAAKAEEYGLHGETAAQVSAALARARELATPGDMIFIGGSNFTVAEILT
jgi:dihydrofolate synthase/folylpolyglutamate synthase